MNILGDAPRYRAYLLRCWAEHGQDGTGATAWRYSLEDPHTGERWGFADLAAMVAFLEVAMAPVGRHGRQQGPMNEVAGWRPFGGPEKRTSRHRRAGA